MKTTHTHEVHTEFTEEVDFKAAVEFNNTVLVQGKDLSKKLSQVERMLFNKPMIKPLYTDPEQETTAGIQGFRGPPFMRSFNNTITYPSDPIFPSKVTQAVLQPDLSLGFSGPPTARSYYTKTFDGLHIKMQTPIDWTKGQMIRIPFKHGDDLSSYTLAKLSDNSAAEVTSTNSINTSFSVSFHMTGSSTDWLPLYNGGGESILTYAATVEYKPNEWQMIDIDLRLFGDGAISVTETSEIRNTRKQMARMYEVGFTVAAISGTFSLGNVGMISEATLEDVSLNINDVQAVNSAPLASTMSGVRKFTVTPSDGSESGFEVSGLNWDFSKGAVFRVDMYADTDGLTATQQGGAPPGGTPAWAGDVFMTTVKIDATLTFNDGSTITTRQVHPPASSDSLEYLYNAPAYTASYYGKAAQKEFKLKQFNEVSMDFSELGVTSGIVTSLKLVVIPDPDSQRSAGGSNLPNDLSNLVIGFKESSFKQVLRIPHAMLYIAPYQEFSWADYANLSQLPPVLDSQAALVDGVARPNVTPKVIKKNTPTNWRTWESESGYESFKVTDLDLMIPEGKVYPRVRESNEGHVEWTVSTPDANGNVDTANLYMCYDAEKIYYMIDIHDYTIDADPTIAYKSDDIEFGLSMGKPVRSYYDYHDVVAGVHGPTVDFSNSNKSALSPNRYFYWRLNSAGVGYSAHETAPVSYPTEITWIKYNNSGNGYSVTYDSNGAEVIGTTLVNTGTPNSIHKIIRGTMNWSGNDYNVDITENTTLPAGTTFRYYLNRWAVDNDGVAFKLQCNARTEAMTDLFEPDKAYLDVRRRDFFSLEESVAVTYAAPSP